LIYIKKNLLLKINLLFGKKVKAYETSFSPEIDNIEDFKYIEFYVKKNNKN
jgi:CMP-N-acetylneuraminic acid synthetase